MAITELRIHPALGIARVGNSPDEWFLGPERPGEVPAPPGGFKDDELRVKRQGTRFRVFAYDEDGIATEVTAADATIVWRAHLVNAKAAAPAFVQGGATTVLRNPGVPAADRPGLVIDAGEATVTGTGATVPLAGRFSYPGAPVVDVPLGALRTDDQGRLVVLGGSGTSGSVLGGGLSAFADNDGWHDDVADGPIRATVTLPGAAPVEAAAAWVVVAPPDFAPGMLGPTTLYDRLRDQAERWGDVPPAPMSFVDDVAPLLRRVSQLGEVLEGGPVSHGLFADPGAVSPAQRTGIAASLRVPPEVDPAEAPAGGSRWMPLLDGEATLTSRQYRAVLAWAAGSLPSGAAAPAVTGAPTPDELDRAALEAAVGTPFYPGIEAGAPLTVRESFVRGQAFRLDAAKLEPGHVTARLAIPWQADFYACSASWWPSQRPGTVRVAGGQAWAAWDRNVTSYAEMVTRWHALGFVVPDGTGRFVEDESTVAPVIELLNPVASLDLPAPAGGGVVGRVAVRVTAPNHAVVVEPAGPPTDPRFRWTSGQQAVGPTGAGATVVSVGVTYTPDGGEVGPVHAGGVVRVVGFGEWEVELVANVPPGPLPPPAPKVVIDPALDATYGWAAQAIRDDQWRQPLAVVSGRPDLVGVGAPAGRASHVVVVEEHDLRDQRWLLEAARTASAARGWVLAGAADDGEAVVDVLHALAERAGLATVSAVGLSSADDQVTVPALVGADDGLLVALVAGPDASEVPVELISPMGPLPRPQRDARHRDLQVVTVQLPTLTVTRRQAGAGAWTLKVGDGRGVGQGLGALMAVGGGATLEAWLVEGGPDVPIEVLARFPANGVPMSAAAVRVSGSRRQRGALVLDGPDASGHFTGLRPARSGGVERVTLVATGVDRAGHHLRRIARRAAVVDDRRRWSQ